MSNCIFCKDTDNFLISQQRICAGNSIIIIEIIEVICADDL